MQPSSGEEKDTQHAFLLCVHRDRVTTMGKEFFSLLVAFGGANAQKTVNPDLAPSGQMGFIPQGPWLGG